MRSTASFFEFSFPSASPKTITASALALVAVVMTAAALYPKSNAATVIEPKFACATIDGRVAAKLAVLQERTDARTQAIVNNMSQQRAIAGTHCQAGRIDDAMAIYGLADRALTRYVSYGTGPALPK
jgi:hypothetical protein